MPAGQEERGALGCSVVVAPGTGARPASVAVGVAGAAAAAAGGVRTLKEVLKAAREEAAIMGLETALAKPGARRKHVRQIMV